ncbi:hypothetical protein ABIC75_002223 [Dyella japonica]|uniref:Uncharacterized protein n=1 Tax=Dyella japonica TaxID=231455 RepID=A0ABV2JUH7_9GAMM
MPAVSTGARDVARSAGTRGPYLRTGDYGRGARPDLGRAAAAAAGAPGVVEVVTTSMTPTTELPLGVGGRRRIGGVGSCLAALSGHIAERAWQGKGVRVFVLPCRSIVVVPIESRADGLMLRDHMSDLVATWCRDADGRGPTQATVKAELRAALRTGRAV